MASTFHPRRKIRNEPVKHKEGKLSIARHRRVLGNSGIQTKQLGNAATASVCKLAKSRTRPTEPPQFYSRQFDTTQIGRLLHDCTNNFRRNILATGIRWEIVQQNWYLRLSQ
jgi:hypothetical protein